MENESEKGTFISRLLLFHIFFRDRDKKSGIILFFFFLRVKREIFEVFFVPLMKSEKKDSGILESYEGNITKKTITKNNQKPKEYHIIYHIYDMI